MIRTSDTSQFFIFFNGGKIELFFRSTFSLLKDLNRNKECWASGFISYEGTATIAKRSAEQKAYSLELSCVFIQLFQVLWLSVVISTHTT